jgi:hypothetical protein
MRRILISSGALVALASVAVPAAAFNPQPEPPGRQSRLEGGGWVMNGADKVTFGAHLLCDSVGDASNNLEVNGPGFRFHLTSTTASDCSFQDVGDGKGNPGSLHGSGIGTCNGEQIEVQFGFRDAGQHPTGDRISSDLASISFPPGPCRDLNGPLGGGNIRMFQDVGDGRPAP